MDQGSPKAEARVKPPPPEEMTPLQRDLYDGAVKSLGSPIGPQMALLGVPEVAIRWRDLLDSLRQTEVSPRLWELVILIAARHWDCQFEWWAHEPRAAAAGLPAEVIEDLRHDRHPCFEAADERATYAYVTALLKAHAVSDAVYDAARAHLGQRGIVEMTVLLGHYCNVALTLIAHRVPLPDGVKPPLPDRSPATGS